MRERQTLKNYKMVPLAGPSLAMARCPDKFQQPHPAWAAGLWEDSQEHPEGFFISFRGKIWTTLCKDCTNSLLEQLDTWLSSSESESENYKCCLETRERRGRHHRESQRTEGRRLGERQYPRDYSKLQWQHLELHEEQRSVKNRLQYMHTH